MKFLLVLAVLLVAFWIWRNNRLEARRDLERPSVRPQAPGVMVSCGLCGTHLPETEAVRGNVGVYCSPEHRRQREDASS